MNTPAAAPALTIYLGCARPQTVAAKVLEHSILRHASGQVQVRRLNECVAELPMSLSGHTMFSLQRFCIPLLNQYQGLAVYLDSDMLVFGDILELLTLRDPAVAVCSAAPTPDSGRKPQFSVLLIDCARARWQPEDILRLAQENYRALMTQFIIEPSKAPCLPYQWNSLERHEPGTRLLHYTSMNIQPWISTRNPLTPLWMDALFDALDAGFVSPQELEEAHQHAWVRPSLRWQVQHRQRDPHQAPWYLRLADALYRPPHKPRWLARLKKRFTQPATA
jgi:hypothetical protein